MKSHGGEISIARGVEEIICDPNPMPLFGSFFFYYAFIVFRYKKLCTALAMERRKSINQNDPTNETYYVFHHSD